MRRFATVGMLGACLCVLIAAQGGCAHDNSATTVPSATTQKPLDPLDRGTVHVAITETLDGEPTEKNITQALAAKMLAVHGFTVVDDPAKARYLVSGALTTSFHQDYNMEVLGEKVFLEHQYKGDFAGTITDTSNTQKQPERVEIPEQIYGRNDEGFAKRDIRRVVGTKACLGIVNSTSLRNVRIGMLIDAIADEKSTRTFNEIAKELAAIGNPAVPYLLDALRDDERPVVAKGEYPGVSEENRDSLRYIHVADLALSDIFGRLSGLTIDSDEEYEKRVLRGWTWAWEDRQKIPDRYRDAPDKRATKVPATLSQ